MTPYLLRVTSAASARTYSTSQSGDWMTADQAKKSIIRDWTALPAEGRTKDHAAAFAVRMHARYMFRCENKYQTVMSWLEEFGGND